MDCLANGIQIVILMLEHVQLNILFRVLLDDSFVLVALVGLVAVDDLLLVGGEFGEHLLILGLEWLFGVG